MTFGRIGLSRVGLRHAQSAKMYRNKTLVFKKIIVKYIFFSRINKLVLQLLRSSCKSLGGQKTMILLKYEKMLFRRPLLRYSKGIRRARLIHREFQRARLRHSIYTTAIIGVLLFGYSYICIYESACAFEWNCAEPPRVTRAESTISRVRAAVRTRISPVVLGADPLRTDVNYGKPGNAPVGLPCH